MGDLIEVRCKVEDRSWEEMLVRVSRVSVCTADHVTPPCDPFQLPHHTPRPSSPAFVALR